MFERFTERARQVVVLAQDEARRLRHPYIGTEHLLLGLLREEEGIAARVLESLKLDLETVRAQVSQIVGHGEPVETGGAHQMPFTPRAKKVLELSLREALALGHNHVGTEHVLLGLLHEGDGVATRILIDAGAGPDRVREAVLNTLSGDAPTSYAPIRADGSDERWQWLYGTGAAIGIGAAVFGSGLFVGWLIWG